MQTKRTEGTTRAVSEGGFTLPELMITIVIMGILAAIAIPNFFGTIESRNVEGAASKVASDLRLAHSGAVNRLGTASLSFDDVTLDGTTVVCNGAVSDYCLVRPENGSSVATSRDLPDGVVIYSLNISSVGTVASVASLLSGAERTIYFDNSGASTKGGSASTPFSSATCPAGTPSGLATVVVAAQDGSPRRCVTVDPATSRVEID